MRATLEASRRIVMIPSSFDYLINCNNNIIYAIRMQWNHPQSAHVPLLSAPTGYTKYLLPVSGCWLSSFICHPKNMHSSGVCSWLLHASLMLASVDILPPARKPPLTPIHCQYDHRRPNPQQLSNICGVWINHCYSSRKMIDHVDVHRCRQKIAIKWNDCFW